MFAAGKGWKRGQNTHVDEDGFVTSGPATEGDGADGVSRKRDRDGDARRTRRHPLRLRHAAEAHHPSSRQPTHRVRHLAVGEPRERVQRVPLDDVGASALAGGDSPTVGLIQGSPDASPGYTLFTPLNSTPSYLIDNDGNLINSWMDTNPGGNSLYLLEDGSLLRCSDAGPAPGSVLIAGGDGSNVKRFDWDGNLLWDFSYNTPEHRLHHDIAPMPNGNILMIAWEYKSAAEAIQAGRDPSALASDCRPSLPPSG